MGMIRTPDHLILCLNLEIPEEAYDPSVYSDYLVINLFDPMPHVWQDSLHNLSPALQHFCGVIFNVTFSMTFLLFLLTQIIIYVHLVKYV